jgi:hypothetical protein
LLRGSQVVPVSGLITFDSLQELRLYIRQLLTYYEKQFDLYSQKVGSLIRIYEKGEKEMDNRRLREDNWEKVGMLMVSKKDSMLGTLEIMMEAMEEYKLKLNRTSEVLTNFQELEELSVPEGASVTLYLKSGVPMRIVFEDMKKVGNDTGWLTALRVA